MDMKTPAHSKATDPLALPDKTLVSFNRDGFVVLDLMTSAEFGYLKDAVGRRINEIKKIQFPETAFAVGSLEDYHRDAKMTDDVHRRLMGRDHRRIELDKDLKSMLAMPVFDPIFEYYAGAEGYTIKRVDGRGRMVADVCNIHVFRPPPHNDQVPDFHTDGLNGGWTLSLWMPVTGFDNRDSLNMAPGSHLVRHPRREIRSDAGSGFNGFREGYTDNFQFIRPDLQPGQAILMHANLIPWKRGQSG